MDDDQLLADYKAYYAARAKRYEGSELYPNSFKTETALSEAMNSCSKLEEFKDKLGDLNIKNAIALVQDKETARQKNFESMQETVRAAGCAEVAARIHEADSDIKVAQLASEIEQKHSIEISIDGFADIFYDNLKRLEDIEIARKAKVPGKYEKDIERTVKSLKNDIREAFKSNEEQANMWKPGWKFDFAAISEERHRRKIPIPDEVLTRRIQEMKKIVGVD